ncbi:shikimate kinase, partial [Candidatus Sumerlaeota bacterium]|nr:shikimate kinase [Candidatus Sumerlaeota bacterium]
GRMVASRLGWKFLDTDRMIEQKEGKSIAEIFDAEGERAFRRMESDLALELAGYHDHVFATGGGFVVNPANREAAIKAGALILLVASPEEIWHRIGKSGHRPLLQTADPLARIRELLEERKKAYDAIPAKILTDGKPPEAVADEIAEVLRKT